MGYSSHSPLARTQPVLSLAVTARMAVEEHGAEERLPEEHHLYYQDTLFPNSTLIPVTIICILLFLVGVTGNTMTILIIQRFKDMKTTTNLYLSSMAVSDLVIFLSLPFHLYRLWRYVPWVFGDLLCRGLHYINEGCTYATILHITALSVERYLAICFPLKAKALVTKRRVRYVILALWAFALLSAGPMLVLVGVEYENGTHPDGSGAQCKHTSYGVSSGLLHTMIWVSTVYFFCPMLCLTFLYGSIGRKLWRSRNELRGPSATGRERAHRQTVRILAVVVLAFAVCWLPFHIGRNLFTHSDDYSEAELSQNFNVASMVLFYLSASINPVLYNLMSRKYRAAARRLLPLGARKRPCPAPRQLPTREDVPGSTKTFTGV
ncbi:growth hormone secretagogue receptor type 1-like [Megalops cyprinoides]|uniref:growth hormone secretagogue receptor type 1-like n=1 Tax=Megalops cyprinoides TaxID=118141 RepID=UPI0018645379|nr:growth hormone secretagogue receptor type 1-like [Megalops cyprinoides]